MIQPMNVSTRRAGIAFVAACLLLVPAIAAAAGGHGAAGTGAFPPPLESYGDGGMTGLGEILHNRIQKQPFNLWATLLFFGAIFHTFLTQRFRQIAHWLEERNQERLHLETAAGQLQGRLRVSAPARFFHFLGEVEAVFGIWVVPLVFVMSFAVGKDATLDYINHRVNFTEAVFVVVIMTIASTRPVLRLAEDALGWVARLAGGTPAAWWVAILTVGPLFGSLVTEPGAMTICALLLSKRFYVHKPGMALSYGTLGLLFVAISIGGTLTHFAAPPVLMVAGAWGWDTPHMLVNFGWKAVLAVALSVGAYYLVFRKELGRLAGAVVETPAVPEPQIPLWVTTGHVLFLMYAVYHAHNTPYLILGWLFFLAFVEVTEDFQKDFALRGPLLVGFFLAGLVIHGGLQQWWIGPVLERLDEVPLMIGATVLTAVNDNAAITYLCTLVPNLSEELRYAAVVGAVTGGGLTVIANAPNPAGQSILNDHFKNGVGAKWLFLGAALPTLIAGLCFMLLRS